MQFENLKLEYDYECRNCACSINNNKAIRIEYISEDKYGIDNIFYEFYSCLACFSGYCSKLYNSYINAGFISCCMLCQSRLNNKKYYRICEIGDARKNCEFFCESCYDKEI